MPVMLLLFAVVPMVILRCGDNIFQEPKVDARIGMNQYGMNGDEYNIDIKRQRGEPQYVEGNE